MKISIIDEMSRIDETFIENLCWEIDNEVYVSNNDIKKLVREKIQPQHRVLPKRLTLLVACCLIILIAVPVCAGIILKLNDSTKVNKYNEQFIGTEVKDDYYIIYSNGEYVDSNGVVLNKEELMEGNDALANNRIVNEIQETVICPSSFVEIARVNNKENVSTFPQMILVNDSVCILTKKDGTGWEMKSGDLVSFSFSKIQSEVIDEQNLIIGYIKDGLLCEGESFREKDGQFSLRIQESGEYYIYLRSASSDYLSLEKSILSVERKN